MVSSLLSLRVYIVSEAVFSLSGLWFSKLLILWFCFVFYIMRFLQTSGDLGHLVATHPLVEPLQRWLESAKEGLVECECPCKVISLGHFIGQSSMSLVYHLYQGLVIFPREGSLSQCSVLKGKTCYFWEEERRKEKAGLGEICSAKSLSWAGVVTQW